MQELMACTGKNIVSNGEKLKTISILHIVCCITSSRFFIIYLSIIEFRICI